MATRSFKQKKYGKVKPVKVKPEKTPKPSVSMLRQIYRAVSKQADWTKVDSLAYAMQWWDDAVLWISKECSLSNEQSRNISRALAARRQGFKAILEKDKAAAFIDTIRILEKVIVGYLKVPPINKALKAGEVHRKKVTIAKEKIAPRFEKLIGLLHAMFPDSSLDIEVVPSIFDAGSRQALPRKFDHVLGRMYYSREHARGMVKTVRTKGILALAVQEGYYLARAMSFPKSGDGSYKISGEAWLLNYTKLLHGFSEWAGQDGSPKRLVRRKTIKKDKKVMVEEPPQETA